MLTLIYRATLATLLLTVLLCGAYPLVVTALGKVLFSGDASGGLITIQGGKVVGARLIGQAFTRPEYFHGRPSSAGAGYDAANSSGSNLGPTNQKFADTLKSNVDAVLKENPGSKAGSVPVDLVTASGSGLDPHLSPEAARFQIMRVARSRGIGEAALLALVQEHIEGPQLGLFGEPVVNVLLLNLDLDRLHPLKH